MLRQEEIDRQTAMRNSPIYKRAEDIVALMGIIGKGEVSENDTIKEAIDKLKALNEQSRRVQ